MTTIIFILVIGLNVLWYWIKFTLKNHGYEVSWFWNHFRDIPNIFQLAKVTEDKTEKAKFRAMGILLISGIILFLIIFFSIIPSIGDNK